MPTTSDSVVSSAKVPFGFVMQVLLERDFQHPEQEDLQLFPVSVVSVQRLCLRFRLVFGSLISEIICSNIVSGFLKIDFF